MADRRRKIEPQVGGASNLRLSYLGVGVSDWRLPWLGAYASKSLAERCIW